MYGHRSLRCTMHIIDHRCIGACVFVHVSILVHCLLSISIFYFTDNVTSKIIAAWHIYACKSTDRLRCISICELCSIMCIYAYVYPVTEEKGKTKLALSVSKTEDFSAWYQEVWGGAACWQPFSCVCFSAAILCAPCRPLGTGSLLASAFSLPSNRLQLIFYC